MPVGCRPSFSAQVDVYGWSYRGCSYDHIAALPFADAVTFVQQGMLGVFPRPEITGRDLRAYMLLIFTGSQRYLKEGKALQDRLNAYIDTLYDVNDKTPPVVSNVKRTGNVITWMTNKPTLGYVAFGTSRKYHRYKVESSYTTSHSATIESTSGAGCVLHTCPGSKLISVPALIALTAPSTRCRTPADRSSRNDVTCTSRASARWATTRSNSLVR